MSAEYNFRFRIDWNVPRFDLDLTAGYIGQVKVLGMPVAGEISQAQINAAVAQYIEDHPGTLAGLTDDVKQALLQIARKVAYIDDQGQSYYNDLYNALCAVTSVSLDETSLMLTEIGDTQQLTATTIPAGAIVTWASSDTTVATVSSTGLVTTVSYGNATITATAGSLTASCTVVVSQASLSSISAVYTQSGTVYDTDSLNSLKTNLVVTATWSDETQSTVASADYTLSGTLTAGTSTITVAYGGKTTTFTVTVTAMYQLIAYVERPSTAGTKGYTDTGYSRNISATVEVQAGFMVTQALPDTGSGYVVVQRQKSSDNTIGGGVYVNYGETQIATFNGTSCIIEPEGGSSIIGNQYDIVATFTATGMSITDGTHTNTVSGSPRNVYGNMTMFGSVKRDGNLNTRLIGRIYYLKIYEGSVLKVDMVPCKRTTDGLIGFYDRVSETFSGSTYYTAGADVEGSVI